MAEINVHAKIAEIVRKLESTTSSEAQTSQKFYRNKKDSGSSSDFNFEGRAAGSSYYGPPSTSNDDFVRVTSSSGKEVFKRKKKKIPLIQRSLAIVLASLQGIRVAIELKNDIEITGVIEETDNNMNLTLNTVRQLHPSGTVLEMDISFIQGSNIRYVHIPPQIPIVKHLTVYMRTIERVSSLPNRTIVDRKKKETLNSESLSAYQPKQEVVIPKITSSSTPSVAVNDTKRLLDIFREIE